MIVVRDVFRLKFGAAKEAKKLWIEGAGLMKKLGGPPQRALVDVTGPYYTFVLESTYPSVKAWDESMHSMMGGAEWERWYARFKPLIESGYREIFSEVEV